MISLSKLFFTGEKNDNSQKVVGVDIGSSSIKVVELQERDKVLTLTTYGEIQLGPYANKEIGESVILEVKKEQQALVDVIRESAVKAKNAVFSMPLSSSFVTAINFNAKPEEDLSSRVRVEARKYIPVPIAEVSLDWAEIESSNLEESGQRSILVAAIQNEALNRFQILMQFAGLSNPPTEIECFSSLRCVYNKDDQDVALIDIGAVSTKLYIARNGVLQRIHRLRAGGVVATKRIASTLDLNFEEAEILKRSISRQDSKFSDVKKAYNSCFDRALQEFRQVIKEYEEKLDTKIETVYLAGGGSLFPTARILVEDTLRKEVVTVNPFNKVAYPAFMEDLIKEIGPSFHVALGGALRLFE
jgi:type IV pilus assembly protein PilM